MWYKTRWVRYAESSVRLIPYVTNHGTDVTIEKILLRIRAKRILINLKIKLPKEEANGIKKRSETASVRGLEGIRLWRMVLIETQGLYLYDFSASQWVRRPIEPQKGPTLPKLLGRGTPKNLYAPSAFKRLIGKTKSMSNKNYPKCIGRCFLITHRLLV